MRLVKFLASAGIASRRAVEKIIAEGRVSVNGKVVFDPACGVEDQDVIEFDGSPVKKHHGFKYAIFHKPVGVVSTMTLSRETGPCLADFVKTSVRLFPVGRLDRGSSGLILLTNDGELTYRLTHPKHNVTKEYSVRLNKILTSHQYKAILKGVRIDGRIVFVDQITHITGKKLNLVIHEGRKRIVRRMFGALGYEVQELKRVRIGDLGLGKLAVGRWRYLSESEIEQSVNVGA